VENQRYNNLIHILKLYTLKQQFNALKQQISAQPASIRFHPAGVFQSTACIWSNIINPNVKRA